MPPKGLSPKSLRVYYAASKRKCRKQQKAREKNAIAARKYRIKKKMQDNSANNPSAPSAGSGGTGTGVPSTPQSQVRGPSYIQQLIDRGVSFSPAHINYILLKQKQEDDADRNKDTMIQLATGEQAANTQRVHNQQMEDTHTTAMMTSVLTGKPAPQINRGDPSVVGSPSPQVASGPTGVGVGTVPGSGSNPQTGTPGPTFGTTAQSNTQTRFGHNTHTGSSPMETENVAPPPFVFPPPTSAGFPVAGLSSPPPPFASPVKFSLGTSVPVAQKTSGKRRKSEADRVSSYKHRDTPKTSSLHPLHEQNQNVNRR